ncbi:MAG: hypothetical protein IPL31_04405 [Saprospiraceae bacterium]|nr:hypothetical protein [Saprospiraceae bacterium]
MSSIQSNVGATINNNNVTGNTYGIGLWNCPTTNPITITGGVLTGNEVGVYATNYYSVSNGDASSSNYIIDGVSIQTSAQAGIEVNDTSANTNASTCFCCHKRKHNNK